MTTNGQAGSGKWPVDQFQRMISGKYKLRIIWDLQKGPKRYSEIKKGLTRGRDDTEEIAARVLSRELKMLAELGLLTRKDYQVVQPKVEYTLTAFGKSLVPVIARMHDWSIKKGLSVTCE